jgi:hypothetical protein
MTDDPDYTPSTIVYVSIGNSDDGLSQTAWAQYCYNVNAAIRRRTTFPSSHVHQHGEWYSLANSAYQNACWRLEFGATPAGQQSMQALRNDLVDIAGQFGQESISWAVVGDQQFLRPTIL